MIIASLANYFERFLILYVLLSLFFLFSDSMREVLTWQ
jgi:hypothetical protein